MKSVYVSFQVTEVCKAVSTDLAGVFFLEMPGAEMSLHAGHIDKGATALHTRDLEGNQTGVTKREQKDLCA